MYKFYKLLCFYGHSFAIILQYFRITYGFVPILHLFCSMQFIDKTDICLFQEHDNFIGIKFLGFEFVVYFYNIFFYVYEIDLLVGLGLFCIEAVGCT